MLLVGGACWYGEPVALAQNASRAQAVQLDDTGFPATLRVPATAPLVRRTATEAGLLEFRSSVPVLVEFQTQLQVADAAKSAAGFEDPSPGSAPLPALRPAACMYEPQKVCARFEVKPDAPVSIPSRAIASIVGSPLVHLFARRVDGLLLQFGEGWIRLAPADHFVVKVRSSTSTIEVMPSPPELAVQPCESEGAAESGITPSVPIQDSPARSGQFAPLRWVS
jgi:hypothetical protein